MIKAGQLRQNGIIVYNGQFNEVLEAQHHKPGKGGAFIRAKLRNLSTGSTVSLTLRPEDTFDEVYVEQKPMQYLYKDDLGYCFMDEQTYEQIHVPENKINEKAAYLKENIIVTAKICNGEVLSIDPPIHVILEIVQTDPGFKGDTVSGATKPAELETGKVVKVPLFVEQGQLIKVDTRTGEYVERA
ncbi:MAG: elongation factor P [Candidatus Omnitrophota bacterium]